uniref:Ig-like domain-containing protein n=1 Tax=Sinocyclocheilus rhinocerous TaxID=307959 RepID=A0A673GZ56_9TELE
MWKKSEVSDQTATGQVGIKKKSKVPGVMITQFIDEIPEGKSHPDFIRKPIALTIQEGKLAIFKAIVVGDPIPNVTWARNNGDISDPQKYQTKFDPNSGEHTIEMPNISPDQADTYKCFAINEFGKAMVTVMLNVIEGMQKQRDVSIPNTAIHDPNHFKVCPKTEARKDGEIDPKFWEILLSADKKDYECICAEYGVTDFRWMLKKLNEMKREREQEQAEFVKSISNLKHIDVNPNGSASFELDLNLLDASSGIFIYKDGDMIPYSQDLEMEMKHNLNQVGKKYIFTIRDLVPDDAGLYQLDVEDVNVFSTEFKPKLKSTLPIPMVDFLVKLKDVKAMEREDAIFEFGKNNRLEEGDKYDITVSEDKLIHRLLVKDCMQVDKGIYAAVAGIKSSNAWLIVEVQLFTRSPAMITLERPPSILVPLKFHSPPRCFQLYMTCAVRGFPTPHVSWYLNNVCINSNNSYYITNAYGVCSMYIIRVGPEHSGEYKVVAVNSFGKAECSTKLKVRGM